MTINERVRNEFTCSSSVLEEHVPTQACGQELWYVLDTRLSPRAQ